MWADDEVGYAGLVLQQQEDESLGGLGLLPERKVFPEQIPAVAPRASERGQDEAKVREQGAPPGRRWNFALPRLSSAGGVT